MANGRRIVLATIAVAACRAADVGPPADARLPLDTWGGDSAGMIVGDTATHLHVACTFGDVSGRIAVAADGRFDVAGTYVLRACPVAIGPPLPARFVGRVLGEVAIVTVSVDDAVEHRTVVAGRSRCVRTRRQGSGPCPICRRPIVAPAR